MKKNTAYLLIILAFVNLTNLYAQEKDSIVGQQMQIQSDIDFLSEEPEFTYDPLRPARAAFYSAIFPGLGQIYNKKYWKLPLVYAAVGTTMYFYLENTNSYNRYRDAYRMRLVGQIDEFSGVLTEQNLIDAQKLFRKNRDLSLLFVVGAYILNIVDANVDAHLSQFNVSENLSLKPSAEQNFFSGRMSYGLSLNLRLD